MLNTPSASSVGHLPPPAPPQQRAEGESLLLELQVPFKSIEGRLFVEAQALNGLRCWSNHFSRITVCAPVQPETMPDPTSVVWADPAPLLASRDIALEGLPWGYHPVEHLRRRGEVRARFRGLIPSHRYLCFSNLGSFGAWGNLAAIEARALGRPYSLWFDWVMHRMTAQGARTLPGKAKDAVGRALALVHTYRAIYGCDLGLFHGKTVYDAYAPLCRAPALVHDVHVKPRDAIGERALRTKLASLDARNTLRLGYAGRVHPMKDPLAWIDVVAQVCSTLGPERVEATWIGDGPLLEDARARVRELGLEARIHFPGYLDDRPQLLAFMRSLDVFLFCHVTPESPRCLLESLISATPLVGYDDAYARDIVADRGGALFSGMNDVTSLAEHLCRIADQRAELRTLVEQAATSRALYNDEAVFEHRSQLIKSHLP